mgnify:FL=1|tara:strand:+ start:140803 stop:141702 length:900 start_codon:yes stop_codon:yes gene_type:complete
MFRPALAILALACSIAIAQPAGDPPPQRDHRQPQQVIHDSPQDAESLRKRLLQTLSFAKRIVEKHEAALAQLDAGAPPQEVIHTLRTPDDRRSSRNTNQGSKDEVNFGKQQPRRMAPDPELSPRDLKRVRAFIAQHLPEMDAQLSQIEAMSPEGTDRLVARLAPRALEILDLEQNDPTMSALKLDELKAGLMYIEASRHYRGLARTGSKDKAQLKEAEEEVRLAASARFDAQVQIKQYEIHQLNMRIQQLHTALQDLNAQRDVQVEAQVTAASRTPGPRFNRQAQPRSGTEPAESDPED